MSTDEHALERIQELDAQVLAMNIKACQDQAQAHQLKPVGECHAGCGARFEDGDQRKFCDDECAWDWEDVMRMEQRRTGRFRPRSLIGE